MFDFNTLIPCPHCHASTTRIDFDKPDRHDRTPRPGECLLMIWPEDPDDDMLPASWLHWCQCGYQRDPDGYPPLPTWINTFPEITEKIADLEGRLSFYDTIPSTIAMLKRIDAERAGLLSEAIDGIWALLNGGHEKFNTHLGRDEIRRFVVAALEFVVLEGEEE